MTSQKFLEKLSKIKQSLQISFHKFLKTINLKLHVQSCLCMINLTGNFQYIHLHFETVFDFHNLILNPSDL